MGNGCAFHLCAESVESFYDPLLDFLAADKLVAADHSSMKYLNFRIHFFTSFLSQFTQTCICLKGLDAKLWNHSRLVTEDCGIHIVVHQICGNHNVSDVDLIS